MVGDRDYPTDPGTVVYTRHGTFHKFVKTGDEPVKLYFLCVPGGEAQAILHAELADSAPIPRPLRSPQSRARSSHAPAIIHVPFHLYPVPSMANSIVLAAPC